MASQVREEREDCIAVALAERTEELARVPLHRLAWQREEVTPAMLLLLAVKKAVCMSKGEGWNRKMKQPAPPSLNLS